MRVLITVLLVLFHYFADVNNKPFGESLDFSRFTEEYCNTHSTLRLKDERKFYDIRNKYVNTEKTVVEKHTGY